MRQVRLKEIKSAMKSTLLYYSSSVEPTGFLERSFRQTPYLPGMLYFHLVGWLVSLARMEVTEAIQHGAEAMLVLHLFTSSTAHLMRLFMLVDCFCSA